LNAVWFVVSPQNPFKKSKTLLHEFDRLDMVEMAIEDNPRLKAIDIEFRLPKPSYTIDTLTVLQEKYPQHTFRLIIGEDNLEQFMRWKNADKILEYYGLYVYPRPDAQPSELLTHPNVTVVEAPLLDISATYIRERIREQKSVKYLVPQRVEEYMLQKKFYR
jgi:nicotinate-nucleotide adenylyltransferase